MKRIGVVVDNEYYNDARVLNECKVLADSGFKVYVSCFDYGRSIKRVQYHNIKVDEIKINRKKKNIFFAFNNSSHLYDLYWRKQIIRFIGKYDIDVLHVHDLYMSKPAHWACIKTGRKFVLDLHENYPAAVEGYQWMHQFPLRWLIQPGKWKRKEKKYLSYPEKIVVLSESFRDDLVEKYPFRNKKDFIVYPNVPNVDELLNYPIDKNILNKGDSFILFYFGIVSERRGIFTLIEAVRHLKQKIPKLKVLIIGPVDKAESSRFKKTINDTEIKDQIIYYSWKDISYFPSYVNISDICISPIVKNDQHESGVANKVYQYMLFEKPVIVSDCKPQKRLVEDEGCGLSFMSENVKDLAEKINYLFNNPDKYQSMGKRGKKAIIDNFNMEMAGEKILKYYSEK